MLKPARGEGWARRYAVAAAGYGVVCLGLLLATSFAADSDPSFALPHPGDARWWGTAFVAVSQALALSWVGRFPAPVLAVLAGGPLVLAAVAPNGALSLTYLGVVIGLYLVVSVRALPRLWLALPVLFVVVAATQFTNEIRISSVGGPATFGGSVLQGLIVIGLPVLPGLAVAAHRDAREARHREQDALLKAAADRQRAAMSRELHDIAAHHMSGIALVAGTIGRQIDTDPEGAKELALQVRAQSSGVLDDLRRLVGLLREDTGEDTAAPVVESLDAVPALVESRRAAGMAIELVLPTGDAAAAVGPLAQLVAYRIVQESLANAAVHAPGAPCSVELDHRDRECLTVAVRNQAGREPDPGPGGGFGLLGMAERARLVGAELRYGATPCGGWEVVLRLPSTDAVVSRKEPA